MARRLRRQPRQTDKIKDSDRWRPVMLRLSSPGRVGGGVHQKKTVALGVS